MPTRRGWLLAGAGVVLLAAGRVLGLPELYVLGTAALALTAMAVVAVQVPRMHLEASRTVEPAQVAPGAASVAELMVSNRGRGRSPVLLLRDPVGRTGAEGRFLLAPLAPGQGEAVTYLLPTERRGTVHVGPLRAELSDPFSLAGRTVDLGMATKLTVFPAVERLPPALATGLGNGGGPTQPAASLTPADEFFALRTYAEGDDLRRVHWPSTARLGRLVVRQDENEWSGRTSILVDVRRSVHWDDSVEIALSAAASVASAARGSLVRMVGTDGRDSGFGRAPAHLRRILCQLADSHVTSAGDLVSSIARVCTRADAGTLVVVTTSKSSPRDIQRLHALRSRFRPVVLVVISRDVDASPTLVAEPTPDGVVVVDTGIGRPLGEAWRGALAGRRPSRRGVPRRGQVG